MEVLEYKLEVLKQTFSKQLVDAAEREADLAVRNQLLVQRVEELEAELEKAVKENTPMLDTAG